MHSHDVVGPRQLWSLREDVLVEVDPETGRVVVFNTWGETDLGAVSPAARSLLQRMTLGPVSLDNVLVTDEERAEAGRLIDRLGDCVVGSLGLEDTGQLLLSAIPLVRQVRFPLRPVDPEAPIRLSRFAAVRSATDGLRIESALSRHRVVVHQPMAAALISSLAIPTTVDRLARQHGVTQPVAAAVVAYLVATGMVLVGDTGTRSASRFAEDADGTLAGWPFHDLLFHWRSGTGRQEPPSGGSAGPDDRPRPPMPPVVKPVPAGPRYRLYRPDLARVAAADPGVTDVVEAPRSRPGPQAGELTAEQVGELLYRTARVRSIRRAEEDEDEAYEVSDRPYPNGYDLYELELYLTVDRCVGLPRGIFHYDPLGHALTLVNPSPRHLDDMLDEASVASGDLGRPALMFTITSRIGRLSRRYGDMAYATTLRNVGLLQGTLGVVATAMGRSWIATALGECGDNGAALRLDWPAEVQVGELVL